MSKHAEYRMQDVDAESTIDFMRFRVCFLHAKVHVRSINSDLV